MERLLVVGLLVALCSATSPPFPNIIPLDCNATQLQTDLAVNLINEERDEGFLFRPVRVESVFQQASVKIPGAFIYYLDLDVIETDCSVLSGKSWKDCDHPISFHEMVFGHCKATIFIARPWRILKLVNYNCTLGTVPPSETVKMCPDCPALVKNITPDIEGRVDRLIEKFNKDSNYTHYFKLDNIERVRTQYVFGQSYFFQFTIKETECLKTQSEVNLANCNFLKDQEADVGFCKGSTYFNIDKTEALQVSCEIYAPREDKDDHGHRHCHHGPDSSKTNPGQESHVPKADEGEVQQEGPENAPRKCEHHKRCPHHRGHRGHRCGHDHHHSHDHPHHHHHHHHHDHLNDSHPHDPSHHHHHHDHLNDSHPHDPSHHHHPHHHHHHHHHNHTSSKEGSSSEEHSDHKQHSDHKFEKRSKGSVQIYDLSDEQKSVPVPTIVRLPPPEHPGKHGKFGRHGKHDNIEFPSEHSKLATCPGEPLMELPGIVKNYIFN